MARKKRSVTIQDDVPSLEVWIYKPKRTAKLEGTSLPTRLPTQYREFCHKLIPLTKIKTSPDQLVFTQYLKPCKLSQYGANDLLCLRDPQGNESCVSMTVAEQLVNPLLFEHRAIKNARGQIRKNLPPRIIQTSHGKTGEVQSPAIIQVPTKPSSSTPLICTPICAEIVQAEMKN